MTPPTLYAALRLTHVGVAVLGLGSLGALGVVGRDVEPAGLPAMARLARVATGALAAMLVTGAALDWAAGGAWHEATWFRLAAISMVAPGAAAGRVRWALARWGDGSWSAGASRTAIVRGSALGVAGVLWITALMELRPFG